MANAIKNRLYPYIEKYINENLKDMTILNERLSVASILKPDKLTELEALADSIIESMKDVSTEVKKPE